MKKKKPVGHPKLFENPVIISFKVERSDLQKAREIKDLSKKFRSWLKRIINK